ncbi:unnamed protein product [Dicrocoelium dendriticum]|nr:unnamed protein product [Dicrocoelium dendriticum]
MNFTLGQLASDALEPSYYDIIGVDPRSSTEQIEAEFRLKARMFHPDKNKDVESSKSSVLFLYRYAAAAFQRINRAKEVLTNPALRNQYESWFHCSIEIPFEQWLTVNKSMHSCMHWGSPTVEPKMLQNGGSAKVLSPINGVFNEPLPVAAASSLLARFRAYQI